MALSRLIGFHSAAYCSSGQQSTQLEECTHATSMHSFPRLLSSSTVPPDKYKTWLQWNLRTLRNLVLALLCYALEQWLSEPCKEVQLLGAELDLLPTLRHGGHMMCMLASFSGR
eukprot:scpid97628/ scgid35623/ 